MKIAIIGAGAMGILFSYFLYEDNNVILFDPNIEKVNKINEDGLTIIENDKSTHRISPVAKSKCQSVSDIDLVFLFVKSFNNIKALEQYKSLISKNTILVSLQNGYGNYCDLEKYQDKDHIIIGTTGHGATYIPYGTIIHAGFGDITLGEDKYNKNSVSILKDLFEKARLTIKINRDIDKVVLEKLFINIGINPVTALLDVNNFFIYENKYARELAKKLVYEACQVCNFYGYNFDKEKIFSKVLDVARKTANNVSSMRADLQNKRKSEIDKINYVVVEKAQALDIPCPYNQMITSLIKAKEDI